MGINVTYNGKRSRPVLCYICMHKLSICNYGRYQWLCIYKCICFSVYRKKIFFHFSKNFSIYYFKVASHEIGINLTWQQGYLRLFNVILIKGHLLGAYHDGATTYSF